MLETRLAADLAGEDVARPVRRLSPLHPGLARRVHRRQGPERAAAQRLVQRAGRLLPGLRQAGRHAGHRLLERAADRRGPVRRRRCRARRLRRSRRSTPTTVATARRPARSRPSTSRRAASQRACWPSWGWPDAPPDRQRGRLRRLERDQPRDRRVPHARRADEHQHDGHRRRRRGSRRAEPRAPEARRRTALGRDRRGRKGVRPRRPRCGPG